MSESPRDVGILLKQERERKGIALEVVHESTKIPLDALKAIEEGYKVRTLTAFYYKSFVKIYAQYLGLDAQAVVALIPTHRPAPPPALKPGAIKGIPASGVGAHRVEGVRSRSWNLLQHPIVLKKKKKILKAVLLIAAALLGLAVLVLAVRKVSSAVRSARMSQATEKPAVKESPKKAVKAEESRKASSKTSSSQESGAKPEQKIAEATVVKPLKRVSVTVRAKTSTWINVHVDGVSVFQGHLKKGTASTWQGDKKIELSAKNIGVLEFEVNGRNVGRLARRDLKAKRVIVTPDGLNVEK